MSSRNGEWWCTGCSRSLFEQDILLLCVHLWFELGRYISIFFSKMISHTPCDPVELKNTTRNRFLHSTEMVLCVYSVANYQHPVALSKSKSEIFNPFANARKQKPLFKRSWYASAYSFGFCCHHHHYGPFCSNSSFDAFVNVYQSPQSPRCQCQ